jgi:hypothetical protein
MDQKAFQESIAPMEARPQAASGPRRAFSLAATIQSTTATQHAYEKAEPEAKRKAAQRAVHVADAAWAALLGLGRIVALHHR